jgi:hypothetical protein
LRADILLAAHTVESSVQECTFSERRLHYTSKPFLTPDWLADQKIKNPCG